ncbi:MAG TPA: PAS domain S-box protein [Verrucomicrobiae bacterium]|jgi:PAS domain S-box-containing protein|nr:PAS domain S-box protein [Verrucomicrobiae bacterium]
MRQPLHILIVEDSEHDVIFVVRTLQRGGFEPVFERVETEKQFKAALANRHWDAVIADYNLPQFSAIEALRLLQESKLDLPFIIVSGAIGEETAVAAMKSGAHDYILKNSLARLVPAVERELRDAETRRQRRHVEEAYSRLAAIVESSGDAIVGESLDGIVTSWNAGSERMFGYTAAEMEGRPLVGIVPLERTGEVEHILKSIRAGKIVERFETVRVTKDGRRIDVSLTISPIRDKSGAVVGAAKIARDITERLRAETSVAALSKLGQSLASAMTPLDAARVIGRIADDLFKWDAFTLDLYFEKEDQVQSVLNVDTVDGEKQDVPSRIVDGAPSAVMHRVIEKGAELILREPGAGMLDGAVPVGDLNRPSASLLYVPIRYRTRVIGVLSVQSYRLRAYDHVSLQTLQTLADYCGGALERMRVREDLKASQQQLRALAAHLQSVREEERKVMTREIHDELGQALTGFKMDLAWMRNRMQSEEWSVIRQSILDKIATMGKMLDETANLMRKLCTELRPGVLDDLGLTAALEWQAREYQSRTGIACEVRHELGEVEVDPERSTALFRIFQEILTNVARHAKATRVEAALEKTGHLITLMVKDNGRGIKKSELAGAKSLGLLGMRERAFILGGEVEIRGAAGKGTTVQVKMPLPGANGEAAADEVKQIVSEPAARKTREPKKTEK